MTSLKHRDRSASQFGIIYWSTNGNSTLRFPITCPICGDETLFLASAAKITNALATGVPIWLIVECCGGVEWIASASEVDQITQYAITFRPGLD